tara:strand:+ start:485 stop:634 length:150 start_codon:yes stop_codon:yes gene_type:complete
MMASPIMRRTARRSKATESSDDGIADVCIRLCLAAYGTSAYVTCAFGTS